jgi:NAD(P)-dependent dehydrogenase (short-subunit alcohol dehydrogenase family)
VQRRLEGKVVLVAGAGGIGSGLASRYAQEGARVILGDVNLAAAAEYGACETPAKHGADQAQWPSDVKRRASG